jgi:hypothetical protein
VARVSGRSRTTRLALGRRRTLVMVSSQINVIERWESQSAVDAFRGSGPSDEQGAALLAATVSEYDVGDVRVLSG